MAKYTQILYDKQGPIARVKMNRPRYLNAQSKVLREELDAAFDAAVNDHDVRVIVLSGEGDHFSSGHDLGTPEQKEDQKRWTYPPGVPGEFQRQWELNADMALRWRSLPKPTIAQVQGYCIYGGWIIAASMDLIVAADNAKFVPGHVQYFSVPWDIGHRKAKEILFQSRAVEAREALELGFVSQVVPLADLESETMALAERIAETDPFLTRMIKLSVNQAQDAMGFRMAIEGAYSNYLLAMLGGTVRPPGDGKEGKRSLPGVDRALRKDKGDSPQ